MYGTSDAVSLGRTETRSVDLRVQHLLCGTFLTEVLATVIHAVSPTARFLLFFDGGSRGSPGPGGSGSVIVTLDSEHNTPEVLWAASMPCAAATTTNNQAEYQGLVTGLRAAADNHWHPLAVVGDSHMIIQQLSRRISPKKPHLAQAYAIARRHADSAAVTGWHHHYREYNKMADKAVNVAMDSRASQQVTAAHPRPLLDALRVHLHSDVAHWVNRSAHSAVSLRSGDLRN